MEVVLSDLTLLENQIPLFILPKLFLLLFPQINPNEIPIGGLIEVLVLSLFGYSSSMPNPIYPSHIVELAHSSILWENNKQIRDPSSVVVEVDISISKQVKLNRCATRLQAAGVTIKREKNSDVPIFRSCKFEVKFSYNYGVLEIPCLHITQETEVKWRNFIAWERHRKKSKKGSSDGEFENSEPDGAEYGNVFIFSALFFNDLICCASDVQLLKSKGIIHDELSMSNHDLVNLFRSITKGVERGRVDSSYSNMIDALNTYTATNCVVRFPIIVWHYLSRCSEWLYGIHKFLRRGYNFAAALITLLTVIQTFYAVLSYHYPKNN